MSISSTLKIDRLNKIDIRVLWRDGQENKVTTSKAITYAALLQQLWTDFKLFHEPEFEDLEQSIGQGIKAAVDPPPLSLSNAPLAPPTLAIMIEVEELEVTDAWNKPQQPDRWASSTLVTPIAPSIGQETALLGEVPLDRVRLWKYNLHTKINTEVVNASDSREITLGGLQFSRFVVNIKF